MLRSSLFSRAYCHVARTDPAFWDQRGGHAMPILFACLVLERFRQKTLSSTTAIASLAALQSATYFA